MSGKRLLAVVAVCAVIVLAGLVGLIP